MSVVDLFQALDFLALTEISSHVASMCSSAAGGVAVESSNIQVGHLHAHGQIHGLLQTRSNLVSGSNDSDNVIIFFSGKKNGAASISKELLSRNTSVAHDELVAATLDRQLLGSKFPVELGNSALNLGASLLHCSSVTSKLDVAIVVASRGEDRSFTRVGSNSSWPCRVCLQGRDANLHTTVLFKSLSKCIILTSNKGIEGSRNAPNLSLDIGRPFVSNLEDRISSRGGREGITLDSHINGSIVILLIDRVALVDFGELNLGT